MESTWTVGNSEKGEKRFWKQWDVRRPGAGDLFTVWPLWDVWFTAKCHYAGRSQLCKGEGCAACESRTPIRWTCFLPVAVPNSNGGRMVVQFSQQTGDDLMSKIPEGLNLSSVKVNMRRRGLGINGRVGIVGIEKAAITEPRPTTDGAIESVLFVLGANLEEIRIMAPQILAAVKTGSQDNTSPKKLPKGS